MYTTWNTPKMTFNPPFNEYVMQMCHDHRVELSDNQKKFLKRCYDINVISRRPFDFIDFKPLSNDVFRKRIQRLRPFIETIIVSGLGFYKLKGIQLYGYVTKNPRGVFLRPINLDFDRMLSEIKTHPLMMHDIRLETVV